ncbi:MAG: cell division topological specificity factor MinE [Aquificae bacterium]|nr:cell division topological specificity factor MinE [Aquificota bacterium]
MGIFDFFFRRRGGSAKEAKERLMVVLGYDRKKLPPNFAERLKEDLIKVFSQYEQFDIRSIEVEMKESADGKMAELWISIPFKE